MEDALNPACKTDYIDIFISTFRRKHTKPKNESVATLRELKKKREKTRAACVGQNHVRIIEEARMQMDMSM